MIRKILLFLSLGFISIVFSQDGNVSNGKFSGLTFGDYYYVVKNHNSSIKDQHGFWFRRIYFTYDYTVDQDWSARFRLEMNNEGDFKSNTTMSPFVKDA